MIMKKIFITGSSRGLGLEFAKQFLERGEKVIASCRDPEKAKDLHELHAINPDNLSIIQLEVTEEEGRNKAYKQVEKDYGALDILINNGIRKISARYCLLTQYLPY